MIKYAPLDIQDSAEMANLTVQQYGSCTPRTHAERPANNTPLMIMAKAGFPGVDDATYQQMIEFSVISVTYTIVVLRGAGSHISRNSEARFATMLSQCPQIIVFF